MTKIIIGNLYIIQGVPNFSALDWGGGEAQKQLVVNTNKIIKVHRIRSGDFKTIIEFDTIERTEHILQMYEEDAQMYFVNINTIKTLKLI